MKKAAITAVALLALIAGCSVRDGKVRQVHIDEALSLCSSNGGIASIENADMTDERESCGSRCSRRTGRTLYRAYLKCNNGAFFELRVAK